MWKPSGFALCSNPTLAAPELFDPALISSQPGESNWIVDYSLSGIDAEGWTYAYDFDTLNKKGLGEASAKWNTYVRRRKWRYHDKRGGGNAILQEVKDRNAGTHSLTYSLTHLTTYSPKRSANRAKTRDTSRENRLCST